MARQPNGVTSPPALVNSARWPYFPEFGQLPNLLTHASFDVPAPSMVFTAPEHAAEMSVNGSPRITNSHISQLLLARINRDTQQAQILLGNGQQPPIGLNMDLAVVELLSPDVINGEKMNINRPLGNGRDDDNDGANDNPAEYRSRLGWQCHKYDE